MSLPPVEIRFAAVDHRLVLEAFGSIAKAAAAAARIEAAAANVVVAAANKAADAQAKIAALTVSRARVSQAAASVEAKAAQVSADAVVKSYERQIKAIADRDEALARSVRGLAAGNATGGAGGGGAGGTTNSGGGKLGDFGSNLLRSSIDLAADALKQFAGFVLNDVIGAQLKRSVTAAQFANRLEGVSGDQVLGTLNGLDVAFASIDPKKIESTFATAIDKTHDFAQASEVSTLALKAGQGLGMDPEKIAGLFADKKGELSGLKKEEFSAYISALVSKTKAAGGDMKLEDLAKSSNAIATMAERFNMTGSTPQQKAATDLGLTGLLVTSAAGSKSPGRAFTGLDKLLFDLETANKGGKTAGMFKTGTQMNDLRNSIPMLFKSAGGDLAKLGKDPGGLLGSAQFSSQSITFLRSLGLEKAYQEAEATKAGTGQEAVKSRLTEMMNASPDAGALDKLNDKVSKEPAVELEEAFRQLKMALAGELVPVIKNDIIPALAGMDFASIAKAIVDVVGVLGLFGKGLASVVYKIMEVTGLGSEDTRHKLGVLSGDIVETKTLSQRETDKALYGDKTGTGLDVLNRPSFDDNSDPRDKKNQKNIIADRLPWLGNLLGATPGAQHTQADPMAGLKAQWSAQGGGAGGPQGPVQIDDASAAKIGAAVGAAMENAKGPQTAMSDPARLHN